MSSSPSCWRIDAATPPPGASHHDRPLALLLRLRNRAFALPARAIDGEPRCDLSFTGSPGRWTPRLADRPSQGSTSLGSRTSNPYLQPLLSRTHDEIADAFDGPFGTAEAHARPGEDWLRGVEEGLSANLPRSCSPSLECAFCSSGHSGRKWTRALRRSTSAPTL